MGLWEQINEDIKAAMKAKEADKLMAIRAVKSELLLAKTAEGASDEVPEELGVKILQKMVKQRKDSAEMYIQQGRKDLADKELVEVEYLQVYLPAQLSEEELTKIVQSIITASGASGMKDMGKVMGQANAQLAGRAEGKLIAAKVKQLLG